MSWKEPGLAERVYEDFQIVVGFATLWGTAGLLVYGAFTCTSSAAGYGYASDLDERTAIAEVEIAGIDRDLGGRSLALLVTGDHVLAEENRRAALEARRAERAKELAKLRQKKPISRNVERWTWIVSGALPLLAYGVVAIWAIFKDRKDETRAKAQREEVLALLVARKAADDAFRKELPKVVPRREPVHISPRFFGPDGTQVENGAALDSRVVKRVSTPPPLPLLSRARPSTLPSTATAYSMAETWRTKRTYDEDTLPEPMSEFAWDTSTDARDLMRHLIVRIPAQHLGLVLAELAQSAWPAWHAQFPEDWRPAWSIATLRAWCFDEATASDVIAAREAAEQSLRLARRTAGRGPVIEAALEACLAACMATAYVESNDAEARASGAAETLLEHVSRARPPPERSALEEAHAHSRKSKSPGSRAYAAFLHETARDAVELEAARASYARSAILIRGLVPWSEESTRRWTVLSDSVRLEDPDTRLCRDGYEVTLITRVEIDRLGRHTARWPC